MHRPLVLAAALAAAPAWTEEPAAPADAAAATGFATSSDGVEIAYRSAGTGRPALVFIHGGYADQTFWRHQVGALADRFQVVTLDLAGHGRSGADRSDWTIDAFGDDVSAVVAALALDEVILVGNSLGGPVSLAAARKLPDKIRGVIAVDTFQDADREWSPEELDAYIQALRDDFPATCKQMVSQLLRAGTDPELYAWIEERMCGFDPDLAHRVVAGFRGYRPADEFAAAAVPIRAILGETHPLDLEGNRALRPDYAAVVMEGCGHYPMLERPDEFNRHLLAYVAELTGG